MAELQKSKALKNFEKDIKDVKSLKDLASMQNKSDKEIDHRINAIYRSAFILAFTAWETFIYERIKQPWRDSEDCPNAIALQFYTKEIERELQQYTTPRADRIKNLTIKFWGFDLTKEWSTKGKNPEQTSEELNKIASFRGELAHNSATALRKQQKSLSGPKILDACVKFLEELTLSTEKCLAKHFNKLEKDHIQNKSTSRHLL